jgi:hypothetical protein
MLLIKDENKFLVLNLFQATFCLNLMICDKIDRLYPSNITIVKRRDELTINSESIFSKDEKSSNNFE